MGVATNGKCHPVITGMKDVGFMRKQDHWRIILHIAECRLQIIHAPHAGTSLPCIRQQCHLITQPRQPEVSSVLLDSHGAIDVNRDAHSLQCPHYHRYLRRILLKGAVFPIVVIT